MGLRSLRRSIHRGVRQAVKPHLPHDTAARAVRHVKPYVRKYGPTVVKGAVFAFNPAAGAALAAVDVERTRRRTRRDTKAARRFKKQADAESLAVQARIDRLRSDGVYGLDREELTPISAIVDGADKLPDAPPSMMASLFPSNPLKDSPGTGVIKPEAAARGGAEPAVQPQADRGSWWLLAAAGAAFLLMYGRRT